MDELTRKEMRRDTLRAELAQIRAQLADLARGEQQYLGRLAEVEADLRALHAPAPSPSAGEQSKDAPTPDSVPNADAGESGRAHGLGNPEWKEDGE